jgi:hypothetical protein
MDTFIELLSTSSKLVTLPSSHLPQPVEVAVENTSTRNTLLDHATPVELEQALTSSPAVMNLPFNELQHLLQTDISKANETIQTLLSSIRADRQKREQSLSAIPINPFEKLKLEYLGPDYKSLKVQDMPMPLDFCPVKTTQALATISKKFHDVSLNHYDYLTTNANAITAVNLGNAFAFLSANQHGQDEFIIDRQRLANQLKFADMVQSLTVDYITKSPVEAAYKLLNQFIELHS